MEKNVKIEITKKEFKTNHITYVPGSKNIVINYSILHKDKKGDILFSSAPLQIGLTEKNFDEPLVEAAIKAINDLLNNKFLDL